METWMMFVILTLSYMAAVDMETWMTPVKTLDTSQLTSPVIQVDKALETKIETADADTETDVVQVPQSTTIQSIT